ncbi:MAG: hypothetical protein AB7F75_06105 [Planctomycetota bacterium]
MGRRGFVILVVVALLAGMSVLAVTLLTQSSINAKLTRHGLDRSRAMLTCRSGVEYAITRKMAESIHTGLFLPSTLNRWVVTPDATVGYSVVLVKDSAGAINVNDGIMAGQLELDNAYVSKAINPSVDHPESSRINYRIRMLLNAYGDVHKLQDAAGSPQWPDDSATYTRPWVHSDGGKEGWSTTAPASPSDSLGDKLLEGRPDNGFQSLEEIRTLVDEWGTNNLSPGYLASGSFFDMIEGDLTIWAPHDEEFHRLKTPLNINYPQFNVSTFNLNHGWARSPVSLVNMNQASQAVRAAVFHALTDVKVLAYGATRWELDHNPLPMASQADRHETVSTVSPNFGDTTYTNGAAIPLMYSDNGTNQGAKVLKHLISTRDALLLSKAWDEFTGSQEVIDSFPAFSRFLAWSRMTGNNFYERLAIPAANVERPMRESGKGRFFSNVSRAFGQHAPEVFLPRLLSGSRTLPGFMGAPAAMLCDYLQCGSLTTYNNELLYTAEDFVPKGHLPKISFMGSGYLNIKALGATIQGSLRKIRLTVKIHSTTHLRSQADLAALTQADTDSRVLVGPEWIQSSVPAHPLFGCIGLKDVGCVGTPPIIAPYGCRMNFDGNLSVEGPNGVPFPPQDSNADPVMQPPLQNSQLEGPTSSLFLTGNAASDLSPFGGILLTHRGHGHYATGRFNDSLYWRPTSMMLPNTTVGKNFSKAYVSFWYRVPHGHHISHDNMVLFDATFWEKIELVAGGTPIIGHRPVRITCFLKPTTFDANKNLHMAVWFQMIQSSFNVAGNVPAISNRALPTWSGSLTLQHLPLPMYPGLPPAYPFHPMGIPKSNDVDVTTQWPEWFERDVAVPHRYAVGGVFRPSGGTLHDDALDTPGVWNRVVLGWDLSTARDNLSDRFWGAITTAPDSVFEPVPNMPFTPPENNEMVITFGERHAITSNWLISSVPYKGILSPTFRLNSLIDNVDLRFDTTGPVNRQSDIPLLEMGAESSRRYSPGGSWSILPFRPDGGRLMAVTSHIHDVPDLTCNQRNAPAIETQLEQNNALVPPLYVSPQHPFTSKPVTTWTPHAITPDTRLKFTWSSTDPSGLMVEPHCPDIPWLGELQLLWSLPSPLYLSWEQE